MPLSLGMPRLARSSSCPTRAGVFDGQPGEQVEEEVYIAKGA
jgi:hypothetical protein